MKALGLPLEFLESALGIKVDGILGVFTKIEFGLELLGRPNEALLEAF